MITRRSMGLKKAFITGVGSGVPHEGMDGVYVYVFLGGEASKHTSSEYRSSWRRTNCINFSSSTGREKEPLIRCMIGNIVLISESAKPVLTCVKRLPACRMHIFHFSSELFKTVLLPPANLSTPFLSSNISYPSSCQDVSVSAAGSV
jgi:hypothetical protein